MKLKYKPIPGMLALLDGDIITYRIAFTTQDEDGWVAKVRLNKYIDEILFNSGASDYIIYLTDSAGNFRNKLYPDYKANRTQEKPKNFQAIRDALIEYEAAEVATGQEADDALGIHQTGSYDSIEYHTTICTIDKDLLQVPGPHFNFVKNKHEFVTEEQGLAFFYQQLLTGDNTDNIPGINKIGPVKAKKILGEWTSEQDAQAKVIEAYKTLMGLDEEKARERINLLGQLLWIRRKQDEVWSLEKT